MILPIYIYGSPVLRKTAANITPDYPSLQQFIADMWETMYDADGVGLAAPQVGKSIRMFVVDASPWAEEEPELADFKKTFINAEIYERFGDEWRFSEGCLSLPGIHEDVMRPSGKSVMWMRISSSTTRSTAVMPPASSSTSTITSTANSSSITFPPCAARCLRASWSG